MADKRFQEVYSQGTIKGTKILLDTETKVQYLFHEDGYAGGMTPLLGADGKPLLYQD